MKKTSAVYQIIIGTGMIGIWIILFLTEQIPELLTEPVRIVMHILAEAVTGALLIISGVITLKTGSQNRILYNLSYGALIYTLIASPGYYGNKGEWGVFGVFTAMLIFAIYFVATGQKGR